MSALRALSLPQLASCSRKAIMKAAPTSAVWLANTSRLGAPGWLAFQVARRESPSLMRLATAFAPSAERPPVQIDLCALSAKSMSSGVRMRRVETGSTMALPCDGVLGSVSWGPGCSMCQIGTPNDRRVKSKAG